MQLEALEGVEGIGAFSARLRDEQARANEHLDAALRHAEETDLRGRLRALADEASA